MNSIFKLFRAIVLISIAIQLPAQSKTVSPFKSTTFGRNDKVGKYIDVRGFNMYYETYGKGKPLLMIHQNGGSIKHFLYQIPYFSKSYKVIVADSRAHGKSVDAGDSLSYEMMADDYNALLDSLQLDSCFVIGWSDGAINGLLLALRHPQKVKKLAISGANLWPDTTAIEPSEFKEWEKSYCDLRQKATKRDKLKLQRLLVSEPHITVNQLNKIKCTTLVMCGDHDIILPRHTLLIKESIPKSFLWIVPNCGHNTLMAHKNDFNDVVNRFFQNGL